MAKDLGMNHYSGKVGDVIYFTRNGVRYIRKYGKPDPEKSAENPAQVIPLQNASLFGYSSSSGKAIREAFIPHATILRCNKLHLRMVPLLREAIVSGDDYVQGSPQFSQQTAAQLIGLEWNRLHPLPHELSNACTHHIDFERGSFEVLVNAVNLGGNLRKLRLRTFV